MKHFGEFLICLGPHREYVCEAMFCPYRRNPILHQLTVYAEDLSSIITSLGDEIRGREITDDYPKLIVRTPFDRIFKYCAKNAHDAGNTISVGNTPDSRAP